MLLSRICAALVAVICPLAAMSQAAAPSSDATLQVTSRIVYVDVVVRDSAGHVVRGLTAKDFGVMEDGKPQTIAFFADHTNDFAVPVETPASGAEFSNVGPVSNSVNIILFDFSNTAVQDQPYARKQMMRFLEALPPGHQTALFVLGNRLLMLQNFTGSTDQLIAAAKRMKPGASTTESTGAQQQDNDFVASFEAAKGRSPSGIDAVQEGLFYQRGEEMQHGIDVTRAALSEIAAAVSGYPGRKNLYWLADRFPLYGGPALEIHELAADVMSGTMMSTQDIAEANQGLANAQIAVYPILLTGVDASGLGAEARGVTGMGATMHDPTSVQQPGADAAQQQLNSTFFRRSDLHSMMDNLADATGGHAFYGTNDFAGALQKGFEDGSSYYTLAYSPRNQKWNGAYRKIKVTVAEHGGSLSYRRGYYATDAATKQPDPAQELNAALQPAAPESTMLRLTSSVVPPSRNIPYFIVKTTVSPDGIDFTTDSAGVRHGKLLVLLVALNANGPQPEAPPQTSGVLRLDFTPEQYRAALKSGIQFGLKLPLKPGSYRLRLGVSDMSTDRLGTLDMPVTVR